MYFQMVGVAHGNKSSGDHWSVAESNYTLMYWSHLLLSIHYKFIAVICF